MNSFTIVGVSSEMFRLLSLWVLLFRTFLCVSAVVILVAVTPFAHLTEIRTKVGIVFQNPDDQLFLLMIYDDIAFGPRNLGLDEETVRHRVEDRLKLLHMEHRR